MSRVSRIPRAAAYSKADGTPIETVTYAYNSLGQRTLKSTGTTGVQDSAIAASYDEANRLTQIVLNGETFTLGHDANGNLTSKSGPTSGTTLYTWDARNRLSQIAGPNGTASFRYDALGRRIERNVAGATTGYLYDWAQAIAELRGSAIDTTYHTGVETDEVLARYGSSGNKTLLTDALMSVIAQAHDDQTVQNFYSYSPYGEVQTLGSVEGNPLEYTGRENDQTGLYFYRARYYDPVLKRFVSEDPIGLRGGINVYAYVGGNPISFIDPSGLLCIYSQSTGSFTCTTPGQQPLTCAGYSGNGIGLNNPAAQDQQDVGPLPQGDYSVGAPNRRRGPITLPLTPDPSNTMFGRSGFLIHGDNPAQNNTASDGCIVLPPACRAGIPAGETVRVIP